MSEGNGAGEPPQGRPPLPTPFVLSVALGAVGLVLLVPGVLLGNRALALAGFAAGALSLGAALYWRSLLVNAWAAQKRARRPR